MIVATLWTLVVLALTSHRLDATPELVRWNTAIWGVFAGVLLVAAHDASASGDTVAAVVIYICGWGAGAFCGFRLGVGSDEWAERRSRERQR